MNDELEQILWEMDDLAANIEDRINLLNNGENHL